MKVMKVIGKSRLTLFLIVALTLLLAACGAAAGETQEIKIGYQKSAGSLLLKDNKDFEDELKEKGYTITWSEFNTGISIMEALSAGSVDFANAGDMPALFALARGNDFRYIASQPDSAAAEGIVVGKDSGIESLEDLKGKKIAFNNASIAQYLTIKALETIDLTTDDIETVNLGPADANIAFEKGDVDVWVTWDPYMTVAENNGHTILQTAEGLVPYRSFHFSSAEMIEDHTEVVETYVKYLNQIGMGINEDPTEAAELMEEVTKVPADVWKVSLQRSENDTQFIDDEAINDIEIQAQDLFDVGLVDEEINLEGKIWQPEGE